MARTGSSEEVQVLRFFETGPIEKVEAVFNIIAEKMRERLTARHDGGSESNATGPNTTKRRRGERPTAETVAAGRDQAVTPPA